MLTVGWFDSKLNVIYSGSHLGFCSSSVYYSPPLMSDNHGDVVISIVDYHNMDYIGILNVTDNSVRLDGWQITVSWKVKNKIHLYLIFFLTSWNFLLIHFRHHIPHVRHHIIFQLPLRFYPLKKSVFILVVLKMLLRVICRWC